jgi:hypothetical protein
MGRWRAGDGADTAVVLAVPAWVAGALVPGLWCPMITARSSTPISRAPPPGAPPMLGLLGSTSEWVFTHPDRISVTVSGAD